MLNRRTLRVKAMQTVFAYRQSKEANKGLAQAYIKESFAPDLNSMEVQDKALLEKQKTEALTLFKENYKENNTVKHTDEKVAQITSDAIEQFHNQNSKDLKHFKKNMVVEAEKIFDRYLSILSMLSEFADVAEEDTRLDHANFVKNLLIQSLKSDEELENLILRRNISWKNHKSEIRGWFKDLIKSDEQYQNFLKKSSPSFQDDKEIINHIVKNIIFKNEVIDKFLEEEDLNWQEDRSIIKSLVTKTIKGMKASDSIEIQELSYNWEDDKSFFVKLFEETIEVGLDYEETIAKNTKNWDIERIATTDKIILEMAISEMINFPSIPVKVTINEYIELAKRYSTPKSKMFVNGVLDVIATELQKSGVIRKSGRGLIDNK